MASFQIPDGPSRIELASDEPGKPATGSVTLTVNNVAPEGISGRLSVRPSAGALPAWFTIRGGESRDFDPSEAASVTIDIAVPPGTAPGDYSFRLRATSITDPDNDSTDGASVGFGVAAQGEPAPKKGIPWWVWLIAGLVLLAAIGGGIWAMKDRDEPEPEPTPIVVASSEAAPTADALRAKAIAEAESQAKRWLTAGSDGDAAAMIALAQPPFFLAEGAVMTRKLQIDQRLQQMMASPGAAESFDNLNIRTYTPMRVDEFARQFMTSAAGGSQARAVVSGGGLCLDVHVPDMRNNGGRVQVWQCNGSPQQQWEFKGGALQNAGGLCLDVHAPDIGNNGGRVQVWQCNGSPQQQWALQGSALRNAGGKCLDIHAPDLRNNGGRVQVWDCNAALQQQWGQPAPAARTDGNRIIALLDSLKLEDDDIVINASDRRGDGVTFLFRRTGEAVSLAGILELNAPQ